MLKKIRLSLRDFWRYRYLLRNLINKDFKLKYRRSILGVVWSVLNPLMMNVIMVVVFSTILQAADPKAFSVYLLCGQLLFNFFSDSTTSAMSSMFGAAPLIRKVYIPKYLFPLEKVCFSLVNCLLSFIALIIVLIFNSSPIHITMLLFPVPLLLLFFFSLGMGMILSTVAVFFRDIIHLWQVFIVALNFTSAIFYYPETFGNEGMGAVLHTILNCNPVYWYLHAFRQLVVYGEWITGFELLRCAVAAVVAMLLGVAVFYRKQDKFVLHL